MSIYDEYRDTEIQWIGAVPAHWTITTIKNCFETILGKMLSPDKKGNSDTYENYLCAANIKWGGVNLGVSKQMWFSPAEKEQYLLKAGEVLVMEGGLAGTACIYNGEFSPCYLQNSVHRCYAKNDNINRYLYYWLFLSYHAGYIDSICNRATIQHYTGEKLANTPIALPPLAEQSAIAAYLDRKVSQIDAIISEAKASIEEYRQWKASIIYEAVTKGLDPNAEMKDSGVEWIGAISSAAKMSRVGMQFSIVLGKMLCPDQPSNSYTLEPYYCAANVHFDGVSDESLKEMWFAPEEKERYKITIGDLLVVEGGAGAGGCAIVQHQERTTYIQNSIMKVTPKFHNEIRYLRYLIECLVKKGYVDFVCNKATIPHFTKEKLANVPFPVFPSQIQISIADYLDAQCAKIDSLVAEKQSLISDLDAYKKSLIFEVVTGKRKVV